MSKSTGVVLLLLGLAVGLFLGFNAKAHQATVRDWDRLSSAVAHVRVTAAARPKTPAVSIKPSSLPPISASSTWKQMSAAVETLWRSVDKLWVRVTASIGNIR